MRQLLAFMAVFAVLAGASGLASAQTAGPETAPEKRQDAKKIPTRNASGTVKASSAEGVVVAGKDKTRDAEWTFAVDPSTNIRKGGKSITAGDLKPGDAVTVKFVEQDGKAKAQSIVVKTPKKEAKKGEK